MGILLVLIIILIVSIIIANNKGETERKNDIDLTFKYYSNLYQENGLELTSYQEDKYKKPFGKLYGAYARGGSDTRSQTARENTYLIDKFYESDFKTKLRKKNILNKYGEEHGRKLLNYEFVIGMSKQEIVDSLGDPFAYERQELKTKTKETYFYGKEKVKVRSTSYIFEDDVLIKINNKQSY
jgi:hypothetical protein